MTHRDPRRRSPRLVVDGLVGVASQHDIVPAALCDLSVEGLRLERPFDPATARRVVQLEIDLPGIDEVVWASGIVTRAHLSPIGRTADGQPRFWCRAGVVLDGISRREQRMLRDYVRENTDYVPQLQLA